MEEWFYVKNNLIEMEDIKEIIQRPIWSRFGLRRPKVDIDDNVEACQKAFSIVCAFIGMRDLIHRSWAASSPWCGSIKREKQPLLRECGGAVWLLHEPEAADHACGGAGKRDCAAGRICQ